MHGPPVPADRRPAAGRFVSWFYSKHTHLNRQSRICARFWWWNGAKLASPQGGSVRSPPPKSLLQIGFPSGSRHVRLPREPCPSALALSEDRTRKFQGCRFSFLVLRCICSRRVFSRRLVAPFSGQRRPSVLTSLRQPCHPFVWEHHRVFPACSSGCLLPQLNNCWGVCSPSGPPCHGRVPAVHPTRRRLRGSVLRSLARWVPSPCQTTRQPAVLVVPAYLSARCAASSCPQCCAPQ